MLCAYMFKWASSQNFVQSVESELDANFMSLARVHKTLFYAI